MPSTCSASSSSGDRGRCRLTAPAPAARTRPRTPCLRAARPAASQKRPWPRTLSEFSPSCRRSWPHQFIQRDTPNLFGTGGIQRLAEEMTDALQRIREEAGSAACAYGRTVTRELVAKGVRFGTIKATPRGRPCGPVYDTSRVSGASAARATSARGTTDATDRREAVVTAEARGVQRRERRTLLLTPRAPAVRIHPGH